MPGVERKVTATHQYWARVLQPAAPPPLLLVESPLVSDALCCCCVCFLRPLPPSLSSSRSGERGLNLPPAVLPLLACRCGVLQFVQAHAVCEELHQLWSSDLSHS